MTPRTPHPAPRTIDDEPEYEITLALADEPVAFCVGISGLMQTMPQFEPGIYHVRESGRIVADATVSDDGSWSVEFYSGMRLSPGCIII